MHGVAHATLWYYQPTSKVTIAEKVNTSYEALGLVVLFSFFFYSFLKNHWPDRPQFVFWQSVIDSVVLVYTVPILFGFTFVNTLLFLNPSIAQLLLPRSAKDEFYDLGAVCMMLLPMAVTWIEPLFCDSFLINFGGHAWFDASIPFGIVVYYAIASSRLETPKKTN